MKIVLFQLYNFTPDMRYTINKHEFKSEEDKQIAVALIGKHHKCASDLRTAAISCFGGKWNVVIVRGNSLKFRVDYTIEDGHYIQLTIRDLASIVIDSGKVVLLFR